MLGFETLEILGLIFAILMGMGFGSYTTMPYYRLPNNIKSSGKFEGGFRSACPSCGVQLKTRQMIPLFNWLITRGKCLNCDFRIPKTYLFLEISGVIFSVICYLKYGIDQMYIIMLALALCLSTLTATDYKYKTIPMPILYVILALGLLYRPIIDGGEIYDMVNTFVLACLFGLGYAKNIEKRNLKLENLGNEPLFPVTEVETEEEIRQKEQELQERISFKRWDVVKLFSLCGIWLPHLQLLFFLLLICVLWLLFLIPKKILKFNVPSSLNISLSLLITLLADDLPKYIIEQLL